MILVWSTYTVKSYMVMIRFWSIINLEDYIILTIPFYLAYFQQVVDVVSQPVPLTVLLNGSRTEPGVNYWSPRRCHCCWSRTGAETQIVNQEPALHGWERIMSTVQTTTTQSEQLSVAQTTVDGSGPSSSHNRLSPSLVLKLKKPKSDRWVNVEYNPKSQWSNESQSEFERIR